MLVIEASVIFVTEGDGGFVGHIISGMQPSFSVTNDLIMCKFHKEMYGQPFLRAEPYSLLIDLSYGEIFQDEIVENYEFTLNVGARVIANGIVTRVLKSSGDRT